MSFGSGIGDIIAITQLAWTVYNAFKKAPKEFQDIAGEVNRLAAALDGAPKNISWPTAERHHQFLQLLHGCGEILGDLQRLTKDFESLGTDKASKLQRLKWPADDLQNLRARVSTNIDVLTNFYCAANLTETWQASVKLDEQSAAIKRIEEHLGTFAINKQSTHPCSPPLSPFTQPPPYGAPSWDPVPPPPPSRVETAPVAGWGASAPLPHPPTPPHRAQSLPPVKPTLTAKLYSFTHSRQDLLEAVEANDLPLVQSLVCEYRRDINHSSNGREGETPLTLAAKLGRTDIVRWLLDNRADIGRRNREGMTPLTAAARRGNHEVVRLLLERGADLEAKDKVMEATALHLAIENGESTVEAVQLLLEKGANPRATDAHGRSVVNYLDFVPHGTARKQIVHMLKDYGVTLPDDGYQGAYSAQPKHHDDGYRGSPPLPPYHDDGYRGISPPQQPPPPPQHQQQYDTYQGSPSLAQPHPHHYHHPSPQLSPPQTVADHSHVPPYTWGPHWQALTEPHLHSQSPTPMVDHAAHWASVPVGVEAPHGYGRANVGYGVFGM